MTGWLLLVLTLALAFTAGPRLLAWLLVPLLLRAVSAYRRKHP